ncbi:MAG: hypothetical protein DMF56_27120 [Acidobacteria bacterium]|nr:MAG: hypothetical protein DMF56_27120 [Acidobacteriota bacterium]
MIDADAQAQMIRDFEMLAGRYDALRAKIAALVDAESVAGIEDRCGYCEFIVKVDGHAPTCFVGRLAALLQETL